VTGGMDLFVVLGYLDQRNLGVHEALSEDPDILKELERSVGWLLPQWMTGASRDDVLEEIATKFDEHCNKRWFELSSNPKLQTKLLACCGTGNKVRHRFFKPKRATSASKMTEMLRHKYVDIREHEVALWCRRNSKADFKELAMALGYQPVEVKELVKAYDKLRK
jgi:predicted PolB exonuclease-like 3'-5' exonuclease